jgi:hypothetical protein
MKTLLSRLSGPSLALLGLGLIAVVAIGFHGVASVLVWLGVLPHTFDPSAMGPTVMILAIWAAVALFFAGLVAKCASGVARRGAWLIVCGLALLAAGSGPLATVGLAAHFGFTADPHPNPIFLGILSFLTSGPAIVLVIGGAVTLTVGFLRRA